MAAANEHQVRDVCKIGQGAACCRYLTLGAKGFECAKLLGLKATIDARVKAGTSGSLGDNCPGVEGVLT